MRSGCSLVVPFSNYLIYVLDLGALIPGRNVLGESTPTFFLLKLLVFKAIPAMMKLITTYQSSMIFSMYLRCGILVSLSLPYLLQEKPPFILVLNY